MPINSTKEGGFLLSNGEKMPAIGLGTWDAAGDELEAAVKTAIDCGYRLFDTAQYYCNEREVGNAIRDKIKQNVITRKDVFIITKLWCTYHRPDLVRVAFENSLRHLNLEYIDLYLMHWPMALKEGAGTLLPKDENKEVIPSTVDYVDTWQAMVDLLKTGHVKSVGVSNFNIDQLKRLITSSNHVPEVHEIECHPFNTSKELSTFCKSKGIHIIAYSPLGSPNRPYCLTGEPNLFANKYVIGLAKRYNRTQAQILIRYQLQSKHTAIPKSVTPKRIQSNINVFDFFLSSDDMMLLEGLNFNRRFVPFVLCIQHQDYPFNE